MIKSIFMSLVLVLAYMPNANAVDTVNQAAEEIKAKAQAEAIGVTEGAKDKAVDAAGSEAHESLEDTAEGHEGEEGHAEDEHASDAGHDAGGHGAVELDEQSWSFDGPFGTYDRGALQRGLQVYTQVCSACHGLKYVAYRNLSDLGYSEAQIKAIAAQNDIVDMKDLDEEGEPKERPMRPSDKFKAPYKNDVQARYANNGALPPDLSLIAKARANGPDYIYSLLTGYEEAPAGVTLANGQHWNKVMAGNKIAMAAPLSDDIVGYEDESPTTTEQYAKDVSHFLMWAAEPKMEVRKQTGIKVILFLLVFAGLMYAVKRRIWADVKKK